MPTSQRKAADADTPVDAPPTAEESPAVEETQAPAGVEELREQIAEFARDAWQHEPRVWLTYTGATAQVVMPFGLLEPGDGAPVPESEVARYISTKLFAASNSA